MDTKRGSFLLSRAKIVIFLLAIVSIGHSQTPTADTGLDRLSEAASAISTNQLPRAEELLNSVLATSPNDADALNLLGVVRAKQNRIVDAERLFRRAISSLPAHVGAHINLAEFLISHNKFVG